MSTCKYNGTNCFQTISCSTFALNTFASCNLLSDGAGNNCGWMTGGVTCKTKSCTDPIPNPSAATCTAYLSTCAFNGSICSVPADCTMNNLTTYVLCNATTDGVGN